MMGAQILVWRISGLPGGFIKPHGFLKKIYGSLLSMKWMIICNRSLIIVINFRSFLFDKLRKSIKKTHPSKFKFIFFTYLAYFTTFNTWNLWFAIRHFFQYMAILIKITFSSNAGKAEWLWLCQKIETIFHKLLPSDAKNYNVLPTTYILNKKIVIRQAKILH